MHHTTTKPRASSISRRDQSKPSKPTALLDHDAETCLVGSLVIQPAYIDGLARSITASDFYDPTAATVFKLLRWMQGAGEPITAENIARRLERRSWDPGELQTILDSVPPVASDDVAAWYARRVTLAARRRTLHSGILSIAQQNRNGAAWPIVVEMVQGLAAGVQS